MGARGHPASRGGHRGSRWARRGRRTTTAARPGSRCRAGRGARCSRWRWAASSCCSPTTSRAGPGSCSIATCTTGCTPSRRSSTGTPCRPADHGGHIVFVVDGYTTSRSYPYAERVDLGGPSVSYARASVRATVDAYSGRVTIYLTDPDDPLARAWAEAFPIAVPAADAMPAELRDRGCATPRSCSTPRRRRTSGSTPTEPDVFASGSDVWSRPIALSGPLEVAGGVDFDESDEDDLRLTLQPVVRLRPPPGHAEVAAPAQHLLLPRRARTWSRRSPAGWTRTDGRSWCRGACRATRSRSVRPRSAGWSSPRPGCATSWVCATSRSATWTSRRSTRSSSATRTCSSCPAG